MLRRSDEIRAGTGDMVGRIPYYLLYTSVSDSRGVHLTPNDVSESHGLQLVDVKNVLPHSPRFRNDQANSHLAMIFVAMS